MWISVFACLYILSGVPLTSALNRPPSRGPHHHHPHPHHKRNHPHPLHPHSRSLRPPHHVGGGGPPPNARGPFRPSRGGGGGPPRPSRDAPHRLAPLKHKRPPGGPPPPPSQGKKLGGPPHDLHSAAQTLYDLRGFHIPLGGQEETQRFLRQHNNDAFSRPSGFTPQPSSSSNSPNGHHQHDPRTAPLVFPSFYQPHNANNKPSDNKRPAQTILNIFGHTQHLSQTKYEPAGQSDTSHDGQHQQFRPSQVDLAYTNNNVNGGFGGSGRQLNHPQSLLPVSGPSGPSAPPSQHNNNNKGELGSLQGRAVGPTPSQGTQILNYRAPEFQAQQQHQQKPNNNNNAQEDNEPFIYVYDDEDYEEDEFVDKPQNQINNNRVTPTPQTIRSGNQHNNNFNQLPPTQGPTPGFFRTTGPPKPTAQAIITTSQRPIPIQQHHQNDFNNQNHPQFFHNNNANHPQQHQQSVRENPFFINQTPPPNQNQNNFNQDHRLQIRPVVTTRPNVEIVPSSERKPPPDQSNAITPALRQQNTPTPDRFRRPPPPPSGGHNPPIVQPNSPSPLHLQQQHNNNHNQFFKQNVGPPPAQQQKTFNQVINLAQDEEEETDEDNSFYDQQDQEIVQKLKNPFTQSNSNKQFQDPPSRLRPVNTLVPKNRVPQEDIVLPPNFPFHEQIDKTPKGFGTSTGPPASGRGENVIRFNSRPTTSSEIPPTPQRVQSSIRPVSGDSPLTSPPRSRIPTRGQVYQQTTEAPPPSTSSRIRGRPIRPNRPAATTTTTTTTTTTPRPTFRAITTFSSSTTPVSYDDDGSEEEYPEDEYNANNGRIVDTVEQITQRQKGSIRPVFNNNQIQDLGQGPPARFPTLDQQQRPRGRPTSAVTSSPAEPITPTPFPSFRQSQQQRLNGNTNGNSNSNNNGNRGREISTLESPTVTIKTTTGKPLYYAGKMLSKEGGVYAGQTLPATHMYGSPVPSNFNSFVKKVPESQSGRPAKKQQQQQRGRVRGGDEDGNGFVSSTPGVIRERGSRGPSSSTPSSFTSTTNSRLIHPSRLRPQQVQAPTAPAEDVNEPSQRPVRVNQSPKFIRPSSVNTENDESSSPQPPKRKKIRPGKPFANNRQQPTTTRSEASHQTSEVVPIVSERESRPTVRQQQKLQEEDETPTRKVIRPHHGRVRPSSSTEEPGVPSSSPGAKLKTRRIRPRIQNKPTQPPVETSSLIVEEITPSRSRVQQQRDEDSPSSPAPPKKLRPRIRPNKPTESPVTPEDEEDDVEPVAVVTQSSAKIARKPTEAPGRFSSRFREESVPVVLSTQSTTVADEEDEDEPSRPPSRPTFKPKTTKSSAVSSGPKPKRVRPTQQKQKPAAGNDEDDPLPASIRLKPEDVILNRKPARRIPPGSASDKLKALQERRNNRKSSLNDFKKSTRNDEDEDEDVQDDNRKPHHRTIRRRKLSAAGSNKRRLRQQQKARRPAPQLEEEVEEEEDNPQNDQPDLPFQNKREITSKTSFRNVFPEDEEQEDDEVQHEEEEEYKEEEGSDYPTEKPKSFKPSSKKFPLNSNRGRTPQEVTSDEARSVVGIKRPTSTSLTTTLRSTSTVVSSSERVGSAKRKSWDRNAPVETAQVDRENNEEEEYGEEEDYEGHHSHQKEVKVSTELPPTSTVRTSVRRSESSSESPVPVTTTKSVYSSTLPSKPVNSKSFNPRKNKLLGKLGTTSSTSVVLSTSTSASTSVSSSSTTEFSPEGDENAEEELNPTTLPSSTQASSLKARLRPNKKLLSSIQPRMSATQQREANEAKRHTNLSKFLKLKTSSSTYSPISSSSSLSSSSSSSTSSSNKLFTMATEDPSLPLESIFPIKTKTT